MSTAETRVEQLLYGDSLPEENDKQEEGAKRLLSLDFLRGLAIFLMVILHSFLRMADLSWVFDFDELFSRNFIVIAIVI
ncbi:MAG TPA: hypothetical protein VMZ29_15855 [Candidatus Bathyarchaeia archaeon]|nr:hypothetical protein [Candidatus Bathyarchaeia archaeon]